MSENISGKVVVITGASSGLGEATARLLSRYGAMVVLGARRADRIDALASELTSSGAKALAVVVAFAINEPEDVDVNEILFRPTIQPIYKKSPILRPSIIC